MERANDGGGVVFNTAAVLWGLKTGGGGHGT